MSRRRRTLSTTERAIEQGVRGLGFRGSRFGLFRDPERAKLTNVWDAELLVRPEYDRDLETVDFRVFERGMPRQRIELTFTEARDFDVLEWLYRRLVKGAIERSPIAMAADRIATANWLISVSAEAAQRRGVYDRLREEWLFCGCEPCLRNVLRLPEQHEVIRARMKGFSDGK